LRRFSNKYKEIISELYNQKIQDKKIVVYGIGQTFQRYKKVIKWDNVVSVIDNDINKHGKNIEGNKVKSPEELMFLIYDYIIIFVEESFEDIKISLMGNFFVEEHKIVSWRVFLNESETVSDEMAKFYMEFVQEIGADTILDVGKQKLARCFFTNRWTQAKVNNFGFSMFQMYQLFYEEFFDSVKDRKYDVIFLWGAYEEDIDWNCLMAMTQNYIIWTVSYGHKMQDEFVPELQQLEKWGEKRAILFSHAIVYIFERGIKEEKVDCNIFVVTHKKYNVLCNSIYKPICVGHYTQNGFYSESLGTNIGYLNDRINECSALYWIWKNTKTKYVGLNHYRRYFYNNEIKNSANYLSEDTISRIFQNGFDIILPELTRLNVTVLESIRNSIGESLCDKALGIIYSFFKDKDVHDIDALEHVLSGNTFYKCNMFVTKRETLNLYCEWLFHFLIEATERLDVSGYDLHHKRTMGFFAEIMLTVWLLRQNIRIKELPISEI